MHGHDADIVIPDAHGGMIVTVRLFRLPRIMHFLNKVSQSELTGLRSVHGPLIEHIQIGLACFPVRICASGRIDAGFAHQPPDKVRHGHAGSFPSPCPNLLECRPALVINLLFIALGAPLKAAVIRFLIIEFAPNLRMILIGKAERRMNQGADQIIIMMQVVDHREQGKKALDFRKPVEIHSALIDSRDMHFPEIVHNLCRCPAGRSEQNDNVTVGITLNGRNVFGRYNQGTDIPSHRLALRFELFGLLVVSADQDDINRPVFPGQVVFQMILRQIIHLRHKPVHGGIKHLIDAGNHGAAGPVVVHEKDSALPGRLLIPELFAVGLKETGVGIAEAVNALLDVPDHKQLMAGAGERLNDRILNRTDVLAFIHKHIPVFFQQLGPLVGVFHDRVG